MADEENSTTWENYEQVARYLLETLADQLGLDLSRVEGKQKLIGQVTEWVVDAKGIKTDDGGIVVIECREYTTSKIKQSAMGALAYIIRDVGAAGGIIVTPIGVQEGGQKIAHRENILEIRIPAGSTTTDYSVHYLGKEIHGRSVNLRVTPTIGRPRQA